MTGETAPPIDLTLPTQDRRGRSRLAGLVSAAVSLALLVIAVVRFRHIDFHRATAMVPHESQFWGVFFAYYLTEPLAEWVIYYRLWRLPFAGLAALLRKKVSNELLLSYLGEVQFYAWARARLEMIAAPFGAIKDVAILSALTGNLVTLAMLAMAWQLVAHGQLGMETRTVFLSLGIVLAISLAIVLFRQKLFSLPRRDLWFVAAVHISRIFLMTALLARMWHLVLPDVPFWLWGALATLWLLVSRLPLIPNKDLVFAGLAVFLLGHEAQVGEMLAMVALLMTALNLTVGVTFALTDLMASRRIIQ